MRMTDNCCDMYGLLAPIFFNLRESHFTALQEVQNFKPFGMCKGLAKIGVQLQDLFIHGRLLSPFFIFHRKYFSNPTFIHFAQIAFFV